MGATGGTSKTVPYVDSCNNDGDLAASTKRNHGTVLTGPIDERRTDTEKANQFSASSVRQDSLTLQSA